MLYIFRKKIVLTTFKIFQTLNFWIEENFSTVSEKYELKQFSEK